MPEIRQIRVGGVTYDLVISEDEISATRARASEMSARTYSISAQSSKDSAAQSATASLQNYYNAIQEADRAEDAADRAEAIVGGQFVSYGQDQGLSDTYKAQARKNIDAEPFFIKITTSGISDDTHVVDKTSEEIVHAYEAGRTLVVIWERTFFNEIHTLYLSHKEISYGSGKRGIGLDFTNPMSMNSAGLMTSYVWSFESLSNIWGLTERFGMPLLYDPTTEEFPIENAETFRAAISAGTSNRNLLDNPFFQVNQRNYTNNSANGDYAADRWFLYGAPTSTVTNSGNGIVLTGSGYARLRHHIDEKLFMTSYGQPFTFSIKVNGQVYSHTFNNISSYPSAQTGLFDTTIRTSAGNVNIAAAWENANHIVLVYFRAYAPMTIQAVKLELGSYSTLENDVPPDYQEELAKCQRYFLRIPQFAPSILGYGTVGSGGGGFTALIPTPVPMRPVTSISGTGAYNIRYGSGAIATIASVTLSHTQPNGVVVTGAGTFTGNAPLILFKNNTGYTDISADL